MPTEIPPGRKRPKPPADKWATGLSGTLIRWIILLVLTVIMLLAQRVLHA